VVHVQVNTGSYPPVPANLHHVPDPGNQTGHDNNGNIILDWNDVNNAYIYQVEESNNDQFEDNDAEKIVNSYWPGLITMLRTKHA